MGEVIDFGALVEEITHDIEPDKVLQGAVGKLEGGVIVIGYTAEGSLYFASSYGYGPDTLWTLEQAKHAMMSTDD